MKKRESGILTVEASITLTFFTLFVLFLFSFIGVYQAENMVSHATLQAADSLALECALRNNTDSENTEDVLFSVKKLTGSDSVDTSSLEPLGEDNLAEVLKTKFIAAVGSDESAADAVLQRYGVKNGLSGVSFDSSTVDVGSSDIIVRVNYTVKLKVSFLGADEIALTKTAKAKSFGRILFKITASSQNPAWGSTSGGGRYETGEKTEIIATPNYGYKFVKWSDGSTEPKRKLTVNGSQNYVAVFEKDGYGINIDCNIPDALQSSTGQGNYQYNDVANISCTLNKGYRFLYWKVLKHTDNVGGAESKVYEEVVNQRVDQTYTYTAVVEPIEYYIVANAVDKNQGMPLTDSKGKNISDENIVYVNDKGSDSDLMAEDLVRYKDSFTLRATDVKGYKFLYWEGDGGILTRNKSITLTLDEPNIHYYYAVYTKEFKVTFKDIMKVDTNYKKNGTTLKIQKTDSADCSIVLPKEYSYRWIKVGSDYYQYEFTGWEDENGKSYDPDARVVLTQDTTFYAKYSPHKHQAQFEDDNGKTGYACDVVHKFTNKRSLPHSNVEAVRCAVCKYCQDFNSPIQEDGASQYAWCAGSECMKNDANPIKATANNNRYAYTLTIIGKKDDHNNKTNELYELPYKK